MGLLGVHASHVSTETIHFMQIGGAGGITRRLRRHQRVQRPVSGLARPGLRNRKEAFLKKTTLALLLVASGTLLVAQDGSRWAGPYLGGSLGYGWGKADTRFSALPDPVTFGGTLGGTTVKPDPKGLLAGAQFGYNWQSGRLVYGLEADWSWSDMSGEKTVNPIIQNNGTPYPGAGFLAAGQNTRWLSTLRGRIGFTPSDPWLLYFTGGLAAADVKYTANSDFRPVGTEQYPASFSKTKWGWTAGIGAERFVSDRWSVKLEYLYYDLGRQTSVADGLPLAPPTAVEYKWDTKGQIVRLGVNYHFRKQQPVVAPPPPPPPPAPVEEVKPATPPPPPPPPPPVQEVKPAAVVPPPPPPPPPAKIVLNDAVLHFANAKAELSPEGVQAVQSVAQDLKGYSGTYKTVVTGYTSSTGSKPFNKKLSKRRADAVAKVLVDSGIPAGSVETVGAGPDNPIADNKTAEGQAQNRRVEIEVKVNNATVEKRTIRTQTQDVAAPAKKVVKKKKAAAPAGN